MHVNTRYNLFSNGVPARHPILPCTEDLAGEKPVTDAPSNYHFWPEKAFREGGNVAAPPDIQPQQ